MSKGNKIPITKPKRIGIAEMDDFFPKAFDPLDTVASWNNDLDDLMSSFKDIGIQLKRKSGSDDTSKEIGTAKLSVNDTGDIAAVKVYDLENPDQELTKLPKGTTERVKMVTKKAKLLQKRLNALRKQEGFAEAKYKVDDEDDTKLVLDADTSEIEDKDVVQDLRRSLAKFNDRVGVLKANLKGLPTLAEAVSAVINDAKAFVEEKSAKLKAVIKDGVPSFSIDGIPDVPQSLADFFPDLIKKGWELLMKIIDFVKKMIEEIPGIVEKVQALVEEAKGMPGKVKELASNLPEPPGPKELFSMVKAVKANVAKVTGAPGVIKTVGDTVKETATTLCEAAENAAK